MIVLLTLFVILAGCASSAKFMSDENDTGLRRSKTRYVVYEENIKSRQDSTLSNSRKVDLEYNTKTPLETVHAVASFYSNKFHGKKTASGDIYDKNELSAAHVNYPLGTIVRVTNLKNNLSVILEINDRKPNNNGRAIDVSRRAAEEMGMIRDGIAKVLVEVLEWGNGRK